MKLIGAVSQVVSTCSANPSAWSAPRASSAILGRSVTQTPGLPSARFRQYTVFRAFGFCALVAHAYRPQSTKGTPQPVVPLPREILVLKPIGELVDQTPMADGDAVREPDLKSPGRSSKVMSCFSDGGRRSTGKGMTLPPPLTWDGPVSPSTMSFSSISAILVTVLPIPISRVGRSWC